MKSIRAVTGAFGYSGKYIARTLLEQGQRVITLTNSLHRENPFGDQVQAYPFNFDDPDALTKSLLGVSVLYNTYWVRFNHKNFSHAEAVQNTRTLFQCAAAAGVERVVHISITNPDLDSPLAYFRGKAQLEEDLKQSSLSYAILRPTVLFGKEDILINNIAWALRRFPVFGVFGDGSYKLQPIHVEDLVELASDAGESRENQIINAIGPETFTYRELVEAIGARIGKRRPIVSLPPMVAYAACALMGTWVSDVIITREEIQGLMDNLLHVDRAPSSTTRLTKWIDAHAETLGYRYTSELARRTDRREAYGSN